MKVTSSGLNNPKITLPDSLIILMQECFAEREFESLIINIEDTTNAFRADDLALWFQPDEIKKYHQFSYPKRKSEWLTGRICAKRTSDILLKRLNKIAPSPADLIICNEQSGRPYLHLSKANVLPPGFDISISHSKKYAAALAATCRCGIDIQEPRETLPKVQERFCLEKDSLLLQKHLPHHSSLIHLTLLWSAKEAVRKACSHSFLPEFLKIELIDVEAGSEKSAKFIFSLGEMNIVVVGTIINNYGLAVCIT